MMIQSKLRKSHVWSLVPALALTLLSATARADCETGLNRQAFIDGFTKSNLRVEMSVSPDIAAQVLKHLSTLSSSLALQILGEYKAVRATRSMTIVGDVRGPATRTLIEITESNLAPGAEPLVVRRFSRGDPRNAQGKARIRQNVEITIAEFRNRVLERALQARR